MAHVSILWKRLDRFKALYRRFDLSDWSDEGATIFDNNSSILWI